MKYTCLRAGYGNVDDRTGFSYSVIKRSLSNVAEQPVGNQPRRHTMIAHIHLTLLALPMVFGIREITTTSAELDIGNSPLLEEFFPENDREVARAILRTYFTKLEERLAEPTSLVPVRRFMTDAETDILSDSTPKKSFPFDANQDMPNWTKTVQKLMPTILDDLNKNIPGLEEMMEEQVLVPVIKILGSDVCAQFKKQISFNNLEHSG